MEPVAVRIKAESVDASWSLPLTSLTVDWIALDHQFKPKVVYSKAKNTIRHQEKPLAVRLYCQGPQIHSPVRSVYLASKSSSILLQVRQRWESSSLSWSQKTPPGAESRLRAREGGGSQFESHLSSAINDGGLRQGPICQLQPGPSAIFALGHARCS